uniref:Uncharacterized protein n=1 Tax=Onchocerca volvulus TaxID=6282 RepID=A0A8R1XZG3_ONCVO
MPDCDICACVCACVCVCVHLWVWGGRVLIGIAEVSCRDSLYVWEGEERFMSGKVKWVYLNEVSPWVIQSSIHPIVQCLCSIRFTWVIGPSGRFKHSHVNVNEGSVFSIVCNFAVAIAAPLAELHPLAAKPFLWYL